LDKRRKVFSQETLIAAAKAGDEIGFNQWIDDMELFKSQIDASGLKEFPVVWSMVHEHIACMPVEPHMRVEVGLGDQGREIFDIEMNVYDRLPLEGEARELRAKQQEITDFLQSLGNDDAQLAEFYKGLSFPLSHICSHVSGGSWREIKAGFDPDALRGAANQVRGWRGDRSPATPMYWAFEIIAVSLHCAAIDDPAASACEAYTDNLIDHAAEKLPFFKNKETLQ
jgi:hypothetical protein